MDELQFWTIVQRAHDRSGGDMGRKCEAIRVAVAALSGAEALEFRRWFDSKMHAAYDYRRWGAAYVMHGGCGDDAFIDFRASLISRGRKAYETALADPDSLAGEYFDDEAWYYEGYSYAITDGVEEAASESEILAARAKAPKWPAEPRGEPWAEDDALRALYPRLAEKFGW